MVTAHRPHALAAVLALAWCACLLESSATAGEKGAYAKSAK
jgi:hypothetical protein